MDNIISVETLKRKTMTNNPADIALDEDEAAFDPDNITIHQRMWLTKQMVDGAMTPAFISKKYSVGRNRLKNWVYRYRQGAKRRSVQGRPRVLDCEALASVQEWMGDEDANAMDRDGLIDKLHEAYRATKRRRQDSIVDMSNGPEDEGEKMCHGTLFNYFTIAQGDHFRGLLSQC